MKGILIGLLFCGQVVRAEILECKGDAATSPSTKIEVLVDMEAGKSHLRWVYPDGYGITQGQSLNKRKYIAQNLRYVGSKRVFLQIPSSSIGKVQGVFTHAPQGLENVKVECEILGKLPSPPTCPSNPSRSLLSAMGSAQEIDELEFLLQCGADPNVQNSRKCTPLMLGIDPECQPGNASGPISDTHALINLFTDNGAYVDLQDIKGETALIKAVRAGLQGPYTSFLAAEADFNIKDKLGNTALIHAAFEGNKWIIEDLLEGNPDRRIRNRAGQTAYEVARKWHGQEVADLVRIPDSSITISGRTDGTCGPLSVDVEVGKTVEFILAATDKMFKMDARSLGIDLMADRGSLAKQVIVLRNRGTYKFTCGLHGSPNFSEGAINVK